MTYQVTYQDCMKIVKKVMEHNHYEFYEFTTKICDLKDQYTPLDLIIREYLNNGGGSSKGFLGITEEECYQVYCFVKNNIVLFKNSDLISEKAFNNFGIPLWENYNI